MTIGKTKANNKNYISLQFMFIVVRYFKDKICCLKDQPDLCFLVQHVKSFEIATLNTK